MKRYLPALAGLALGLAACGSSGPATRTVTRTVASPPTATPTTPTTTTPATTATPTATTSTPTTTVSTGTPPCRASGLSLSYLGQQGAAGHGELGFALKNTGTAPCHSIGFPGVLFLDNHGGPLATIPHHTTIDYFGHAPETVVTIAPGATASFRMGVTHGAIPGSVCTTAYGLQVIPPNDTATLRTTIPQGAYECRDATVSPLQAGNSAYR
ncbi:MAG: DUF4232 domain-containing protein [Solirubrobacteraceae bacterium]